MKRRLVVILIIVNMVLIPASLVLRAIGTPPVAAPPLALFFTPDFQAEYKASNKGWHLSDDLLYWVVNDYHGRYINFEGGYRRTIGQPERYTSTLWLVGNSTLVSGQVADKDTIASYLQAMLPGTRVMNVGMGGAAIVHEFFRLRTLPIMPGDTVLLYDGVMDAENERFDLDQYRGFIDQAHDYAVQHGAAFYHVLQPILCTVLDSDWDRQNDRETELCRKVSANWAQLEASETGANFTHLLDAARRTGLVVYVDAQHINEAGNKIVARTMFNLFYPIL